jgi:tRNA-dihydrouridine synthase B
VSVARGCIGNPWIFRQARDLMAGRDAREPTLAEQRRVLEEHFALALAVNESRRDGESITGRTMRKFGIKFAAFHPRAAAVKARMIGVEAAGDWQAVIDEFYQVEGAPTG